MKASILRVNPPPTPATFDTRLREVLRALYRHPLHKEHLLRLNSTYTYPFPVRSARRQRKVSRESRVLDNLLKRAIEDQLIEKSSYSLDGTTRSYFYLTERGFRFLFPNQTVPKKSYHWGDKQTACSRRSSFFKPIAHRDERHEQAVADVLVHCCIQAKRDLIEIAGCFSRNTLSFSLRGDYARRTTLKPLVRLNPVTKCPLPVKIFPDLTIRFRLHDGTEHLRPFEIDGGTERILTSEEVKSITNMVQKYDHHREHYAEDYRVPIITFRSGGQERLRNIMAAVRDTIRDPDRPLFLFSTLEYFLAENGALTRPRFLDHFGESVPCLPLDPGVPCRTCSKESGTLNRLRRQLERSQGMTVVTAAAPAPTRESQSVRETGLENHRDG